MTVRAVRWNLLQILLSPSLSRLLAATVIRKQERAGSIGMRVVPTRERSADIIVILVHKRVHASTSYDLRQFHSGKDAGARDENICTEDAAARNSGIGMQPY